MIGKDDFEVFPAETASIYREEEQPIFAEGKMLLNKINPYFDAQGERRWVSTNKWPVFDANGAVAGVFGISRDVTELKAAQENLSELNRDLEQRVRGKTDKYLNLLRRFVEVHAGDMSLLVEHLAKGDQETARRLVHNVKGAAATLAADRLAAATLSLETKLRGESAVHGDDLRAEIEAVNAEFAALAAAL